jgi:hypothetical protein
MLVGQEEILSPVRVPFGALMVWPDIVPDSAGHGQYVSIYKILKVLSKSVLDKAGIFSIPSNAAVCEISIYFEGYSDA